jgi:hypothetical protein
LSSQQLPLDADGYGLLFAALGLRVVIASARRRAKGEKQGDYGGEDQHSEMITNGMVDRLHDDSDCDEPTEHRRARSARLHA